MAVNGDVEGRAHLSEVARIAVAHGHVHAEARFGRTLAVEVVALPRRDGLARAETADVGSGGDVLTVVIVALGEDGAPSGRLGVDGTRAPGAVHVAAHCRGHESARKTVVLNDDHDLAGIGDDRKSAEADAERAKQIADMEELNRLKKENDELKKENDFLKKAAAFFAKENK